MNHSAPKILYTASSSAHLVSFHLPYLAALRSLGWDVTAAANGSGEGLGEGVRFLAVPFTKSFVSPRNFRAAALLARDIRKNRYDVIVTHTSLAAFFTRLGVMLAGKKHTRVVNTVHGYLFDGDSGALRRTVLLAAEKLTALFNFNIPLRWSVAHLYQCVLDGESHLQQLSSMNTLAGYVHYLLTGRRVLGVGDAAGMFPIDPAIGQYDAKMLAAFDRLVADKNYPWTLADLLPEILPVGTPAGTLTPAGAALLDPSGTLQPGAVFCPPEGDAGTGMVATNSVAPGTGNVSAGTSVFAMVVLDRPLARVHREIDMVTTPCGHPVAMVHANNCSSQVNVIAGLLRDFAAAMGQPVPDGKIYDFLFNSAVDGAPDCDGIVTYGYTSGESILNLDAGRPLTVRRADSTVNWPNLMRSNLCGALAALKVGMDILTRDEQVPLQRIYGHGGFFTTPQVGQRLLASALAAPVTVMETAGSGGPWGMALLAAYMLQRQNGERLAAFLERQVFACCQTVTVEPTAQDVADFDAYMQAFHAALDLERRAAEGE